MPYIIGTAGHIDHGKTSLIKALTGQDTDRLKEEKERGISIDLGFAHLLKSCNKQAPGGYFRLPVDRAFVLQGHGVVVTGTALSGEIRTGDRVRCLPGDQMFRVRSLQVHGRSVETAGWGQRVALNLTGSERAEIARGHVICQEKLT